MNTSAMNIDIRTFNELKDRLIRATGSSGTMAFSGGTVHMTLGDLNRLVALIEERTPEYEYFVVPEYVEPKQVPSNALSMTLDEATHRVTTLLAGIGETWKILRRRTSGQWEHMGDGKTVHASVKLATDTTPGAPYYGRHPDGKLATEPPDLRVYVPVNTLTYAANVLESSADNGDKYTAREIREAIAKAHRAFNHG